VERWAADLSAYPNLVVIYLGMRVYTLRGLASVLSLRNEILREIRRRPDGLLHHESFYFSLLPLHIGLRQYWRDFASLEAWTRQFPHQQWWKTYVQNPRGTGFWHETYCRQGGIEGIYDYMAEPTGLLRFAPRTPAVEKWSGARERLMSPEAQRDGNRAGAGGYSRRDNAR
jgi:Domain of unknown function (DUF4188)